MPIKRAKSAPQPVEAIFTLTKANINHAVTATRVDLRRTKSHLVQPLATNTSVLSLQRSSHLVSPFFAKMPTLSEQQKALLVGSNPENFNFHSDYSVVIDQPISTVFPVLAHGHQAERVVRLSELCTDFQLFHTDIVVTPNSAPLIESRVRAESPSPSSDGLGFPRQYFSLQETVPLLFGLTEKKVEIVGTQTWDENAKVALYETVTDQGIMVWKSRMFKEIEDDGKKKTSVIETIKGSCPGWMKFIVQSEASKAHRAHMNKYHTLF